VKPGLKAGPTDLSPPSAARLEGTREPQPEAEDWQITDNRQLTTMDAARQAKKESSDPGGTREPQPEAEDWQITDNRQLTTMDAARQTKKRKP